MAAAKKDTVTGTTKQKPRDMSPKDRQATFVHLAETTKYNAKHSLNHASAAAKIAERLAKKHPGEKDFATLLHNTQHAAKHAMDVEDHSGRLMEHLKSYPGGNAAFDELMNPKPSTIPSPPKANGRSIPKRS